MTPETITGAFSAGLPEPTAPVTQAGPRGKRPIPPEAKPFDEHFKQRRKDLIAQYEEAERMRIEIIVTMIKRFRGDSLGFFYKNRWEAVPSKGLKKYNLFWPVVRSNATNWITTNLQPQMKAARSDSETEAGAQVCQALADFFKQSVWSESFDEQLAFLAQLERGYHLESCFSKDAGYGEIKVPVSKELEPDDNTVSLGGGEYACPQCGSGGPNEVLDRDSPKCPECGHPVEMGEETPEKPLSGPVPAGYESMPEGDNMTYIRSSFEIRLDEVNAKANDPKGAYWFNHHALVYLYEIYQKMPWLREKLKDKLPAGTWSESLQWKRALEMSAGTLRTNQADTRGERQSGKPDDLVEYCRWWFLPVAVEDYVSPTYYKHESGKFDIYPGENVRDAFTRLGKKYCGLYLSFVHDELGLIETDDKNKRWTGGGWGVDAEAYWGKGQEDLLDFQEVVNELLTLMVDHAMHNSLPHVILDRRMFDVQNFKNRAGSATYTRAGFNREGRPLSDFFAQLLPGGMDAAVPNLFASLLDGAQNTMGVQPSTVGAPDPTDKTYQGQLLKRQASVGLLIPSQKSKKRACITWLVQQLMLVQRFWTAERIKRTLSNTEHSWDDADITAFKNMDLERDLIADCAEGSDIPVSHQEKKNELYGLIGAGIANNPNVPRELQSKAFQYAGVPFNDDDYEAQTRSAESRFREMREWVKLAMESNQAFVIAPELEEDPISGELVPNPAAGQIVPNKALIVQILAQPNVKILPRQDDHETHIKFYNRRIIALAASPNVNEFELTLLTSRVDEHLLQIALNARDAIGMETFAQAPAMEAAGAQEKESDERKAEQTDKQNEAKAGLEAGKQEDAELQRQHERVEGDKQRRHESTESTKAHQAKRAEAAQKAKAKK
jgi:hypothetical protein